MSAAELVAEYQAALNEFEKTAWRREGARRRTFVRKHLNTAVRALMLKVSDDTCTVLELLPEDESDE